MELSFLRKLKSLINNRKGYTLIILIVILLLISLLLGATLSINFTSRAKSLQFDTYRAQALYLAEAGVREVIWSLKYGQSQPQEFIEVNFENWKGRAEMKRQVDTPTQGKTTIISTGIVPYNTQIETQRVIKVIIDSASYQIESWEEVSLEYIK